MDRQRFAVPRRVALLMSLALGAGGMVVPSARAQASDSLYRGAREAINRGDWRRAAQLCGEVGTRYQSSTYAGDCTYWEAFARYRIGTTEELRAADRLLAGLAARSTPLSRETDVAALQARVRGALAQRGEPAAVRSVERQAQQAGSAPCDQEDLMVRVEALNALSQMDANGALPILRRVLERKDECQVELRRRALFMLARRADTAAARMLEAAATGDPSFIVRAEAVSYLPRMPGDIGRTVLEQVLRTDSDERVQRAAVQALAQSDDPQAHTSLRAVIERQDAPERLRLMAIGAFDRDRATPADAAYLREVYGKLNGDRLKEGVINAVARLGGKENAAWLAGIVGNAGESYAVRAAALSRLSRMDVPTAELSRMYDAADSRSMREQLISALGDRPDSAATDKLIDIAKTGTDPNTRRLAINALSRKNDPRATKLLMEIIEK